MVDDDEARQHIVDAAAKLFAVHGYGGTDVRMVAKEADVPIRTVRRLTGTRAELFKRVMATRVTSRAAEQLAEAVADPGASPPLAALLTAAQEIFTAPARSWDVLELEALTRANLDDDLRTIESARIQRRVNNLKAIIKQSSTAGGVDPDVDADALAHFTLALSAGLAIIDPVIGSRPRLEHWNALMARIGTSVAPADMLLLPEHEAGARWRVRIDIPDRPGGLARLVRAMGSLHMSTVSAQVVGSGDGTRTIDLALISPAQVSQDAILAAALSAGSNAYITVGTAADGVDTPTRTLDFASELVRTPSWGPQAAARLVEADHVEVQGAAEGEDDSVNVMRLQWTPDLHVVLRRNWAPFAGAEQTRASALLRLSAAIADRAGEEDEFHWVEPIRNGTAWIRLAHPDDARAITEMHHRCSERSRYLRYFSLRDWRDVQLRRLAGGHRGATLVAMSEPGKVVALGNVFPEGPEDQRTRAEVAIIVEDAYQGRGLGTALFRRQLQMAQRLGFSEVTAVVLAENKGMLHLLKTSGLTWTSSISSGIATMRAALPQPTLTASSDSLVDE